MHVHEIISISVLFFVYTVNSCVRAFTCTVPSRKRAHGRCTLDWGMGHYSRYQYRSYTWRSAQVNYLRDLQNSNSSAATIDFSLIQARLPIESEGSQLSRGYFVDGSRIKWAWLQLLAAHDRLCWNVGIRLVLRLFGRLFIDLTSIIWKISPL